MMTGEDTTSAPVHKLHGLRELGVLLETEKARGRRIVHCHGVFDLLHLGHIRHLAEARALGDLLVVSITADRYVNKGPHRPAFTQSLRAEALAALAAVDYVTISDFPTALEAITAIAPDIYVKGSEYRTAAHDVTGGITIEEQAVLAAGGIIHYTDDITFSSSTLINRYMPTFSSETEQFLTDFRAVYSAADVIRYLDLLRSLNVAVVGEVILDEYIYCEQMGKSAKDPVLAMRYQAKELFAGGSLAVANHLASFVESVELISYLGSDEPHEHFIRNALKANVRASFFSKSNSPTIIKRRYVEQTLRSKLFELYVINDEPIDNREEAQLCSLLDARLGGVDAVIAADFGHGLLTRGAISRLTASDRFLAVNTQINAANIRYHAISAYDRADYVCINEQEVRLDARSRNGKLATLVNELAARLRCERIMVTRGSAGVSYFAHDAENISPSFASNVVDRTGSGDAVLAITAVMAATGAPPPVIAFIANVIGAQKVQIVGNRSAIDRVATIKFVEALLK